jgi:hypothetical protein
MSQQGTNEWKERQLEKIEAAKSLLEARNEKLREAEYDPWVRHNGYNLIRDMLNEFKTTVERCVIYSKPRRRSKSQMLAEMWNEIEEGKRVPRRVRGIPYEIGRIPDPRTWGWKQNEQYDWAPALKEMRTNTRLKKRR